MGDKQSFDIFLSHNSRDKPEVEAIGVRLREAGFDPFLDKWHLVPGMPWQSELSEAIRASTCIAVCFGPNGEGPWHHEEMQLALLEAVRTRDEHRLIPLLLPGSEKIQIEGFLELRTWVDFRSGLDDEIAFDRLVAGIKGIAPDSGDELLELSDTPRPYRGISRFEAAQHEFFFGRDEEVRQLVGRMERDRIVAIVGASGSGKSSLARAGLSSDAAEKASPGIRETIRISMMPKSNPLTQLATAVVSHLPVPDRPKLVKSFTDGFKASSEGLNTALSILFPSTKEHRVILIVDQFEEIFTQRPSTGKESEKVSAEDTEKLIPREGDVFAANLLRTVENNFDWLTIVITLRADFLDEFVGGKNSDYRSLLERRQFWLGAMGKDDLREVIARPAAQRGAFFEKGLVELILRDMRGPSGALPLLEEALAHLWSKRRGYWLTHDAYMASGGVGGALASKAEEIFSNLLPADRALAGRVFVGLVQLGEGTRDTRRRAPIGSLATVEEDENRVLEVIKPFADKRARLISLSAEATVIDEVPTTVTTAEVTHEALIEHWQRLDDWLNESRDDIRFHRRLDEAAIRWQNESKKVGGKPEGLLWRSPELDLAREFVRRKSSSLNKLQDKFYNASIAAEKQESKGREKQRLELRNRLKLAIWGLGAAVIGLLIAVWQWNTADAARRDAVKKEERATREEERAKIATAEKQAQLRINQGTAYSAQLATAFATGPVEPQRSLAILEDAVRCPPEAREITWEVAHHRFGQRRLLTYDPLQGVLAIAFLPAPQEVAGSGERLAVQLRDGSLEIIDVRRGLPVFKRQFGVARYPVATFSPGGDLLALASETEGKITIFELGMTAWEFTVDTKSGSIRNLAFDQSGSRLFVDADNRISCWQIDDVRSKAFELAEIPTSTDISLDIPGATYPGVAFNPLDRDELLVGGYIEFEDLYRTAKFGRFHLSGGSVAQAWMRDWPSKRVIYSLAFLPDASRLAIISQEWDPPEYLGERTFDVLDFGTGKRIGSPLRSASSLAISHDRIALGTGTNGFRLSPSQSPSTELFRAGAGKAKKLAFSRDGRLIAAAMANADKSSWFGVWTVNETDSLIPIWPAGDQDADGDRYSIKSLGFEPSGKRISFVSQPTGLDTDEVKVEWDPVEGITSEIPYSSLDADDSPEPVKEKTMRQVMTQRDQVDYSRVAIVSQETSLSEADRRVVVSALLHQRGQPSTNLLLMWDDEEQKIVKELLRSNSRINFIHWFADGGEFLTVDDEGKVQLWTADDLTVKLTTSVGGEVWSIATRAGRQQFALLGSSPDFQLSLLKRGDLSDLLAGQRIVKGCIAFSPNPNIVAVGGGSGTLYLVDCDSGATQQVKTTIDRIQSLTYSPDGRTLAAYSADQEKGSSKLALHEATSGQVMHVLLPNGKSAINLVFSPSGDSFVTVSDDGEVVLWPTKRWEQAHFRE